MCGIIGVVTTENNCFEILLNGLKQLQNRGYDSAGICSIGMERAAALSEAKGAGERGNSGDDCRRSLDINSINNNLERAVAEGAGERGNSVGGSRRS